MVGSCRKERVIFDSLFINSKDMRSENPRFISSARNVEGLVAQEALGESKKDDVSSRSTTTSEVFSETREAYEKRMREQQSPGRRHLTFMEGSIFPDGTAKPLPKTLKE